MTLEFSYLPLDSISPNPLRPRASIQRESLLTLADSIRRHGILTPILVGKTAAGLQIIAGERRLRAAKLAGLNEIPAVIRQVASHRELALFSLAENIHREELNLLDQAKILHHAREKFGLAVEELAEHTGVLPDKILKLLKALKIPEEVKTAHLEGHLTSERLWQLLDLDDTQLILHEADL